MRIISKKKLREFWQQSTASQRALEAWHFRVAQAGWGSYQAMMADIPSADIVGDCVVFNILHNQFRLIARIRFRTQIVYVLRVMSHAEYDRTDWKAQCGCFQPPPARIKKGLPQRNK